MTVLIYCISLYFLLLVSYFIVLIVLYYKIPSDRYTSSFTEYPMVSVLIAARNEEQHISYCIKALSELSWPKEKIELLVGDDQSTDATAAIVTKLQAENNRLRLVSITENLGTAKGKANVLANLARIAKGDLFYITDADIEVPPNWIQSLYSSYTPSIGIVSGATETKVIKLFHACQNLDWLYAFGLIKIVSDNNIPVTAVGNNMMISRKAYESVGGYESIPFSLTEDHQLFVETLKKGWEFKNLYSKDSLAKTQPIQSLTKLLSQRKRWMQGAMKLPFILLMFLFLQGLYLPFLVLLVWQYPLIGTSFGLIKFSLQTILIQKSYLRIEKSLPSIPYLLAFELYAAVLSILVILNYLLPSKIDWKGRKY